LKSKVDTNPFLLKWDQSE